MRNKRVTYVPAGSSGRGTEMPAREYPGGHGSQRLSQGTGAQGIAAVELPGSTVSVAGTANGLPVPGSLWKRFNRPV
jgi:hypothetical protein